MIIHDDNQLSGGSGNGTVGSTLPARPRGKGGSGVGRLAHQPPPAQASSLGSMPGVAGAAEAVAAVVVDAGRLLLL